MAGIRRQVRTVAGDWRVLVLAAIGLFVLTMAVSATLAPSLDSDGEESTRTLVGVQGGGTEWKKNGRVVLYNGSERVHSVENADSYFDVTWLGNGSALAGYHTNGNSDCGRFEAPCARTGFRELDLDRGAVTAQYSYPVRGITNSETHDVEPLGDGRYLLTDMEHERIHIVADGETTWQWNASSFYNAPPDPTKYDWLHVNDVDVIEEGRYLVSVRNANQILIVERGEGVVEVINEDRRDDNDDQCTGYDGFTDWDEDGEVRCGDGDILDHQHNPQWLGEGAILVADSGNDRLVELHRDDGQWRPVWTVTQLNGVELRWPRDADRLANGNTLVTDSLNRRVVEITPNGSVVWGVRTDLIPYEADRVPDGELVGANQTANETAVTTGTDVPVLSTLLVGVQAVYPRLPFWFRELQLAVTVVSLLVVGISGIQWYRTAERGDSSEE